MKNTFLILFVVAAFGAFQTTFAQSSNFFKEADVFFGQYVKNGMIDYQAIKKNGTAINHLTQKVGSYSLDGKSDAEQKAFMINAYNILVIKSIVDKYPVKSPMNISGFFDGLKHTVAGKKMTLNGLEKGTLLKKYPDARLHFVLVCAAVSCPPIADFAFVPSKVEAQIEQRTKQAINNKQFIKGSGNNIQLSEIFKWYKNDFVKDAGSGTKYLNKYLDQKISDKAKLKFYTYDWTLNAI